MRKSTINNKYKTTGNSLNKPRSTAITYNIVLPCVIIMIAVFSRDQRDFVGLNPTPRKEFRRIRGIDDTRGLKFTAVIRMFNWYDGDKSICDAYEALQQRQPELF